MELGKEHALTLGIAKIVRNPSLEGVAEIREPKKSKIAGLFVVDELIVVTQRRTKPALQITCLEFMM